MIFLTVLFLFLAQVYCYFSDDLSKRVDRLMIYHRFKEAREIIDGSPDMAEKVCSSLVISRCIDLRNYKSIEPWILPRQTPATRSFLNALNGGGVTSEPEEIKSEANAILEIILPRAIEKKEILTRALNSATFHADYVLIDRLIALGWDKFGEDEDGMTPLMTAIKHHRRLVFNYLIENGTDIHYVNNFGENLVHIWAKTAHSDHVINVNVHDLIVKAKLDYTKENLSGYTPTQIAVKNHNHDVLDLLQSLTD